MTTPLRTGASFIEIKDEAIAGSGGAVTVKGDMQILTRSSAPPRSELTSSPLPGVHRVGLVKWRSCFGDKADWAQEDFSDGEWTRVKVPHNWDDYHGYHAVSHGNLHGTAWYRSIWDWCPERDDERVYAFFEGVGSYASVFCNGHLVGEHAGGRTTFTLDLTSAARKGRNVLAVRAHHPEKIDDLPFVCGGCWGSPNTEGSQPLGIFRPVWIERMGPVRVQPFGLHVFAPHVNSELAAIEARVELYNAAGEEQSVRWQVDIFDPNGEKIFFHEAEVRLKPGETRIVRRSFPGLSRPRLWSPRSPELYQARATVVAGEVLSHVEETTFGLRWLEWPAIPGSGKDEMPQATWAIPSACEAAATGDILFRHESALVTLKPGETAVKLNGSRLPDTAELIMELSFHAVSSSPVRLFCEIQNADGTVFFHQYRTDLNVKNGDSHGWKVPPIHRPALWSTDEPSVHKLVVELQSPNGDLWERSVVFFGIRRTDDVLNLVRLGTESHPAPAISRATGKEQILRLNGEPLFLMGTCEYETLLGGDHAFTEEQIAANVAMMKSAGFNAFRDAHHPHNLRYYHHWDQAGIVCWSQMGSHIWFDNDRFRDNYRRLVTEWVRERRNHPSVILWGLQNESLIPEDFARELTALIRELDPTSPQDRLTTTCNGGAGSDWNVPQDWCGTYGGNCNDYDLAGHGLVGEFGAWRAFGVHTEREYTGDENDYSETWACYAMETKIRLGEEHRDRSVGHFHWVFNTFPNPGRSVDNFEGPGNGQIGSVNNKGLVTAWMQPSDLYYLFRANYADPTTSPMVYIVSHTWPDRWKTASPHDVRVFSNCPEVELFDGSQSLGKKPNPGRGRHFCWNAITLISGELRAVGRSKERDVALDTIVFEHLWKSPTTLPLADEGAALFRISCGDAQDRIDALGYTWQADRPWQDGAPWGSVSWGRDYTNVADDLASCGYTMTPVQGTAHPELYRTYRYGRHKLRYHFALAPGRYRLRLHLTEPWFGIGGKCDCRGWRLFDVAVNGTVLERDLDIWSASGGDHRALIREYEIEHREDLLAIHFPFVRANHALICGIEIFDHS